MKPVEIIFSLVLVMAVLQMYICWKENMVKDNYEEKSIATVLKKLEETKK